MRTDDLIRALAQDPAVRWPFGRAMRLGVLAGIAAAGGLFFLLIGFRPDITQAIQTVRFPFKFVVTVTLAVAALGLLARLARPGAPVRGWSWAMLASPALLGLALLAELMVVPAADWSARMIGHNARNCLTIVPALSLIPLALLLVALRHGAPSRPGLAGAVAGLAAAGVAATFYASNCFDDSPLFVATWYPIAVGAVALLGGLAGRRMLRW